MGEPERNTLVDWLTHWAESRGERTSHVFLRDGETDEDVVSFAELHRRCQRIGVSLASRGPKGSRALLLYVPSIDYVTAFLGCLYAGWSPIPAYPPDPSRLNRSLPRIMAILKDAKPDLVLTTSDIAQLAPQLFPAEHPLNKLLLATDTLPEGSEAEWTRPAIDGETTALIQYTSGSTATPKGVLVSHANLIHNLTLLRTIERSDDDWRGVCWLPPYHDMGLIGGVLRPVHAGYPISLMSPFDFLKRPIRWLWAITRYRAQMSLGPNFAYSLVARKVTEEQKAEIDLSTLRVVYNGAEPVRARVIDEFSRVFESCGFQRRAFLPCYGLAESTLIVSGVPADAEPEPRVLDRKALGEGRAVDAVDLSEERQQVLVHCGTALEGGKVVIVDPETRAVMPDDHVGEVWLQSPSVAHGYLDRPTETEATFGARTATGEGPFLRTGDLGFLRDGKLTLVSRIKDLIIIRGQNHYPSELEMSAEQADGRVRRGCSAAFSVEIDDEERLVLVCEVERRHVPDRRATSDVPPKVGERRRADRRQEEALPVGAAPEPSAFDADEVANAIVMRVATDHEVTPNLVVFIQPGSTFKTPSGKIQRRACRRAYLAGELPVLAERRYGM